GMTGITGRRYRATCTASRRSGTLSLVVFRAAPRAGADQMIAASNAAARYWDRRGEKARDESYEEFPWPSMPRFRFPAPGSGPNQTVNSARAKSSPGTVPRTAPRSATSTPASGHQVNDMVSPFLTSPMSDLKRAMDASVPPTFFSSSAQPDASWLP